MSSAELRERRASEGAARRSLVRLRALLEVADHLARVERVEPTLNRVVGVLARSLPIAGAVALVLVDDREVLASAVVGAAAPDDDAAVRRLGARLAYFGRAPESESELATVGAAAPARRSVVLPLLADGQAFGAIELLAPGDGLDEDDLVFANAAAHGLAAATSRASRGQRALKAACDRLEARYQTAPVGLLSLSEEGDVVELNDAAARLLAVDRRALGLPLHAFLTNDGASPLLRSLQACFGRDDRQVVEEVVTPRARRDRRLLLLGRRDDDAGSPRCSFAVVDVTARERELRDREALVQVAVRASLRDPAQALDGLCAALVPLVADLCVVDLVEGGRADLRRRAHVRALDPAREQRFCSTEARWGELPIVSSAELDALRTGQVQLVAFLGPAELEASAVETEHLQDLLALALRSWLVVPIVHPRARTPLALLRLATAGVRRPFDGDDARLLERVATLVQGVLAQAYDRQGAGGRPAGPGAA